MFKKILLNGLAQIIIDLIRNKVMKKTVAKKEEKAAEPSQAFAPEYEGFKRKKLVLKRIYSHDYVLGILEIPVDGKEMLKLYTIELPWRDNEKNISCVPEGEYVLRKRESAVVRRTSGGAYTRGWEVCDVPDRTHIMIHVGNTVDDIEGCIAVGTRVGYLGKNMAVLNSRAAFSKLMEAMADEEYDLIITEGDNDEFELGA